MWSKWQVKKDSPEIDEMKALAAAYRGKVTHCPPGAARGHELKPKEKAADPSQRNTPGDAP